MKVSLIKIKTIPFEINREIDEVLFEGITSDNMYDILDEFGYDKAKVQYLNGVQVFYKTRRNGVYLAIN